jgi:uncharacterized membrane protein YeiH
LWLDAIGLAAFAAMGAERGLTITGSPVIAIITGMFTATAGGILRDIVAGEPSVLLRGEIYVTAAAAAAAAYVAIDYFLVSSPSIAAAVAFVIGLAVRGGALLYGWSFAPYKPRAGRRPENIP